MLSTQQDRFTATASPMPKYKVPSTWERSCPWGLQAPIFPPFRFTDDSIIPVVVRLEYAVMDEKLQLERHTNFLDQLVSWLRGIDIANSHIKCVLMPRRDYLKYFARDHEGRYIGSETQRTWSEEELEDEFGQYQNTPAPNWVVFKG